MVNQSQTKVALLMGPRIGVLKEYFCDNIHPEIAVLFFKFIEFLRSMKCVVIDEVDLHNIEKYYTSWRNIRLAEATNIHLEWLKTRADEYSAEVRDMLLQGKRISAVNYLQSLRAAHEIKNEILAYFSNQGFKPFSVL